MKIKIDQVSHTKNFLDRDFQRILLPMRITQYMFFLSKFHIKCNCIRPNGTFYKIVSFIGMFLFLMLNLNIIIVKENFKSLSVSNFMCFSIFLNSSTYIIAYVLFYIHNVIQSKKHVEMILKIQFALRDVNYKMYKKFMFKNWRYAARHFGSYFILIVLRMEIYIGAYFFSLVYFDIDNSYGRCISKLLREGMLAWISEVEYQTKRNLELNIDEEDIWRKLLEAYTDLLEAFDIFKDVFQIPILFTSFDTLFHALLYLQSFINLQDHEISESFAGVFPLIRLITVIWVMKNIMVIKMFSTGCEEVYMTVEDVNIACCRLLAINQDLVGSKRLCKNVLRLNQKRFQKMYACRLVTIDASLPKDVVCLVVSYTVVLLQFAV